MDDYNRDTFMARLITDMGGAAMLANVLLGDELGLYRAMADSQPTTPEALADKTGCNPRLLREWLCANVASGYMTHVAGQFVLPQEQALALAVEGSNEFMAGGVTLIGAMFHDKDKLVAAMRGDGGLAWGEHHPGTFRGTERFLRPGYKAHLVADWLPELEGMVERLVEGAQVADIGCGHGAATIVLAQSFPHSQFHGFDCHGPSIEVARQRAAEADVADRVQFTEANAKDFAGQGYDLITFFDCLHDMGDPVGAVRHAHQALKPGGAVLVVEPLAGDSLDDNLNPVSRLFYAASTFIGTPDSLSQEVGLGLGGQAGEARLRQVFEEGGFSLLRRVAQTPFHLVLEARR